MHGHPRLFVGALVVCAAVLAASVVRGQQTSAPAPLSLSVRVTFVAEKKGDGAPSLHYEYTILNTSDENIYLNGYGYVHSLRVRTIAPRQLFSVRSMHEHPLSRMRMRPPQADDLWVIPKGSSKVIKHWEWVETFFVEPPPTPAKRSPQFSTHRLRRPGKVDLTLCFAPIRIGDERLRPLLPPGKTLWHGEICAPQVSVHIRALPSQRLSDD